MSIDLLRKAARLGPGYRGRREFGEEERQALLSQFSDAGLDPPPYLEREIDWIDRRAKIFEARRLPR